jgi:all-trans-retinol dehydrogenase (NAD+)
VAGASRGIGKELAILLGDVGALVVCLDIEEVGNEATMQLINARRGKAFAFTCDLTKREQIVSVVKRIESEIGPITMLFHCSGVPSPRSLNAEAPPIQSTLEVGVISHFWVGLVRFYHKIPLPFSFFFLLHSCSKPCFQQ